VNANAVRGADIREQARSGRLQGPTCGLAPDYLQANLVILPEGLAADFLRFCQLNPKPCPILEVTGPGAWEPRHVAAGADIRTDVPMYRLYRHGTLAEEMADITHLWRKDLVSFLLGCSFSFEAAMLRAGLPLRHLEEGRNVPMYRTNLPCTPAGPFAGPLVVSMRPLTPPQAVKAIAITSRFPQAHGAPVHFGEPEEIGIADLSRPDFGDAVTVREDEVPVFWACGVTPQAVALETRVELMITHEPGVMFLTDLPCDGGSGL
jgi:uncharacterized protein YcsI (UPF0317 family)